MSWINWLRWVRSRHGEGYVLGLHCNTFETRSIVTLTRNNLVTVLLRTLVLTSKIILDEKRDLKSNQVMKKVEEYSGFIARLSSLMLSFRDNSLCWESKSQNCGLKFSAVQKKCVKCWSRDARVAGCAGLTSRTIILDIRALSSPPSSMPDGWFEVPRRIQWWSLVWRYGHHHCPGINCARTELPTFEPNFTSFK